MDFYDLARASSEQRRAMLDRMDRTSRLRYYRWAKKQRTRDKDYTYRNKGEQR